MLRHMAGPGGPVTSYLHDNADQSPGSMDGAGVMVPSDVAEQPDRGEESAGWQGRPDF